MTPGRRTYWHLEGLRRKPSDYDIASSKLLFYPERGFEVDTPIGEWYAEHQRGTALKARDWDAFRDPRETTYTRYTEQQKTKETFVDGLLEAIEDGGYDRKLAPAWLATLERVLAPLRYPVHGLQMVAAYAGHLAPAGRLVIVCALQAADEMRRIQRLAYRMRQIQETHAGFGAHSRELWQDDPLWQPWRETIERLLATYDFGEALAALNLVVKPAFDELFMSAFAGLAEANGDEVLAKLFRSLNQDCAWHREWAAALTAMLLRDDPANAGHLRVYVERWQPLARRAVEAFAPVFSEGLREPRPLAPVLQAVERIWGGG